jgi:Flp pilus assembly secretin CpaC
MSRASHRPAPRAGRLAFAALLALSAASPALAAGQPIAVMVDRAKVMHIARPASTVIIGNPAIADATIQDNQTLIITGRSYGTTNLIVLDANGQAIADEILNVSAANDDVVTVYKRSARTTLTCTPDCMPALAVGDQPDTFQSVNAQIQAHNSLSDAAATK